MIISILLEAAHSLGVLVAILLLLYGLARRAEVLPRFNARQRKRWLALHGISAATYFGGVLTMLVLAVSTTRLAQTEFIHAAHIYVQYVDWFMVIPGGLISLLSGFWLALRTPWGLMKHHWVLVKWAGSIVAILFGSSFMRIAVHGSLSGFASAQGSPMLNPSYLHFRQLLFVGVAISMVIVSSLLLISYLKPWGQRRAPGAQRQS